MVVSRLFRENSYNDFRINHIFTKNLIESWFFDRVLDIQHY